MGDGTTSVIILSGEILCLAEPFLMRNIHPTVIVSGYNKALQEALVVCKQVRCLSQHAAVSLVLR